MEKPFGVAHSTSFPQTVQTPQAFELVPTDANFVFLSINRYERKKNLLLALEVTDEVGAHPAMVLNLCGFFTQGNGGVSYSVRRETEDGNMG